jgi:hypothetical protein
MKLAKLSLAAIMTVGALSTVNAQPLEDAIKGVDFSGFARYRYHNVENNDVSSGNNDYDLYMKFVAPVTSDLKATIGVTAGGTTDDYYAGGTTEVSTDVRELFFTYTKDALTVKAGKQPIGLPVTSNGYRGNNGTGIIGMYNLGSVTLAGMHFNDTNLDGTGDDVHYNLDSTLGDVPYDFSAKEISGVAAIGSFGYVNAQLWLARVENAVDYLAFLQVDGSIAGLSLKGQVINTKLDENLVGDDEDTGMFYAIQAGYTMDNFTVNAGYINNDDEQPIHGLAEDANSGVIAAGYRLNDDYTYSFVGGEQYFIDASATFGKIGLMAGYAAVSMDDDFYGNDDLNDDSDAREIWGGVSYAYAKNFNTYIKYSDIDADIDDNDQKFLRFEAKYSF